MYTWKFCFDKKYFKWNYSRDSFFWHIYPITLWNETGIIGTFEGNKIRVDYIYQPFSKFVSEIQDMISHKNKQIEFLKNEVCSIRIEENLQKSKIQEKIDIIKKSIILTNMWRSSKYILGKKKTCG